MQREIKFRAWVSSELTQEKFGFMHYPGDKSDYMLHSNGGDFGLVVDMDEWAAKHQISVMQYTGLKDVNGVEIYDGDVVNYKFPDTPDSAGESIVTCIEYVDDVASFRAVSEMHGEFPIHGDVNLQVIGNIHQNPGLINNGEW